MTEPSTRIDPLVVRDLEGKVVWKRRLAASTHVTRLAVQPNNSRLCAGTRDGRVLFLELKADQTERLRRNEGASRLAEKPSKRDLAWSRLNLLELDEQYQLDSHGRFDGRPDYLRPDNTHLSPAEVAETAIAHFGL